MIDTYTTQKQLERMKAVTLEAITKLKEGVELSTPSDTMTVQEYRTELGGKISNAYLAIIDMLGEWYDG